MPREKKIESKTKKQLETKNVIREESESLEEVKESLKDEIHSYLDSHIKNNIKNYVDETIKKELVEQVEKANKKVIKEKNKKIMWRNIIIILLLGIIGFLVYILYDNNYFARFFVKENVEEVEKKEIIIDALEQKTPTLEELKEKYQYLLKDIKVSEKSSYLEEFYQGDLTKELKNYLALNTLDFSKFEVEEDYNVIEENKIKTAYEKLWTDSFETTNFDYNGHKIRYFNKLKSYITDEVLVQEGTYITREIIDIQVNNNKVSIKTVEGILQDGELQNVLTKEIVEDYEGDSIVNYQDQLSTITYVFNNKKLESIE